MHSAVIPFQFPLEEIATPKNGFRITNRDLDIIKFLSEMKFAAIEDLHQRFFKITRNGEESKSLWWARERISILREQGYLEAKQILSDRKFFYVPTTKAHYLVSKLRPDIQIPRPIRNLLISE